MKVKPLGLEDALEEEMATHSNIFSWKTPWTIQSKELFRQEYWSG